jgi:hypothetical protein
MGTAEEQVGGFGLRNPGVRRYHVWFALSFGAGAGVLPPFGAQTIAGWVGGIVGSFVAAVVISGVGLLAVRSLDDWRPPTEAHEGVPDTRIITGLFLLICLQLFIFGTQISVDLGPQAIVYLLAPLNLLVAGAILWDLYSLSRQGIEWESTDYGYAVLALLVGFAGGLGYWYRRGRVRSAWFAAQESDDEGVAEDDEGSATVDADAAVDAEPSASDEQVGSEPVDSDDAVTDDGAPTGSDDTDSASAKRDDTDIDDRE